MREHPIHRDQSSRFHGKLRHYHRAGVRKTQSWEEWVYGTRGRSWSPRKWLKIAGIVMAFMALGGIILGLIIELR